MFSPEYSQHLDIKHTKHISGCRTGNGRLTWKSTPIRQVSRLPDVPEKDENVIFFPKSWYAEVRKVEFSPEDPEHIDQTMMISISGGQGAAEGVWLGGHG